MGVIGGFDAATKEKAAASQRARLDASVGELRAERDRLKAELDRERDAGAAAGSDSRRHRAGSRKPKPERFIDRG